MKHILKLGFIFFLLSSCGAGFSDVLEDLGKNYMYQSEAFSQRSITQVNERKIILKEIPVVFYRNGDDHIVFKNFPAEAEYEKTKTNIEKIKQSILKNEKFTEEQTLLYALYGKGDDFYKKINIEERSEIFSQIVDILENSRYSDSISIFGIIDKNKHKTDYFKTKIDFENALKERKISLKF